MLSKVRKLVRAIGAWSSRMTSGADLELLERQSEILERALSPIDKHIFYNGVMNKRGLFHESYDNWRVRRCNKILESYGIEFFKDKKILELGAGHGEIGAFFAELGSQVLCLDGRINNVNFARLKHRKIANIQFEQFNLENDFSSFGKFDLIINFGLIYHLRNVESHLNCCFAATKDMVAETVVCDSTDPHKIVFCAGRPEVDEESVEGTGSRPSPHFIERIAQENNFEIVRHFTADLNSGQESPAGYQFLYDWDHKNDGSFNADFQGRDLRRFWRFRKVNVKPT
jgi:SAM-dependent methyltransferase